MKVKADDFWWFDKKGVDVHVPLFSNGQSKKTDPFAFPDIFPDLFDEGNWAAAREQLWAIEQGIGIL